MKKSTTLYLGTVALALTFCSCSSALKKKCEGTNWFEHGRNLAKSGQRVNSDPFLQSCERENATVDHTNLSLGFRKGRDEYCTAEGAFLTGKRGDFFAMDLCEGGKQKLLTAKHHEGVLEHCQASNGQAAGATGRKYNQICPKELEKDFLPQFSKGRKKYLISLVSEKETEVSDLDREIRDLDRKQDDLRYDMRRLEERRTLSRKTTVDPATNQRVEEVSSKADPSVESEINSKKWEFERVDREINQKRERQRAARAELREAQQELITLE